MPPPDPETTQMTGESLGRSLTSIRPVLQRCADSANAIREKTHHVCDYLRHQFTDHPQEQRLSYCGHMMKALHMAYHMGKAAVCTGINAVFPFVFQKTGTNTVEYLHDLSTKSE